MYHFTPPSDEKDVEQFYKRLYAAMGPNHLEHKTLGEVRYNKHVRFPIVYLFPIAHLERKIRRPKKKILVAAGFHGDEPAGPWGLLSFLESGALAESGSLDVSFLPLVNPTGMKDGTHENAYGESPNSGFRRNGNGREKLSREGKILFGSLGIMPRDGFLSLHEDNEEARFYMFAYERKRRPGPMSRRLKGVLGNYFEPIENEVIDRDCNVVEGARCVPEGGGRIKGGIALNYPDGSFEDMLFHDGVPFAASTETPGLFPFEPRVKANYELIASFLEGHG